MSLKEFAADSGTVIDSLAEANEDQFMVIDLNLIVASSHNPRTVFNLPRLQELAESIKAGGVRQPILVRPLPPHRLQETFEGFKRGHRPAYELIAGERRFRASKLAGVDTIPAIIRHLSDEQVLKDQLVENLQRDDLHPMEEAEGYERLIQATGITKEQIGEEIGKSRAYVYARLKLLDLCQDARKAFYEGDIDASRALVIARVPVDKLQAKALAEATAKDWHGGPRHNFKNFALWAQQNLMLRLDAARFKITDESLVPDAGSCRDCVKRTGAQPEVYADVESADVCTDPVCYHSKDAAHEAAVIELARAKGQQVILEKEAKEIWQHEHIPLKGFTRLDRPDSRAHETKALKTVLGKDMPQPILMQNPHKKGELLEVLPTAQVTKLLKESGKLKTQKAKATTSGTTAEPTSNKAPPPVEQRREYHNRWQEEALRQADAHFKGWKGSIPVSLLRAFLLYIFEMADEGPFGPALDLGTEFNASDVVNRLNGLPDSAMPEVFVRWMLHDTAECYHSPWTTEQRNKTEPRHPTWQILDMAGVDVDAIQQEIKRQMESDDRVKEAAAEKKVERAPSAKKSTAPPAAQAQRAKKPSIEEAQREISEALQAHEDGRGEQNQAPNGANEEAGAAPAAPSSTSNLAQVGDRVLVDHEGDAHHLKEGNVMQVRANGKAQVSFSEEDSALLPLAWLKVLSASFWPFPTLPPSTPAAQDAPVFKLGDLARVKAGSKGPNGKLLKTIGKVGRVAGLGDDGRIHLRHGPRSHELVMLEPKHAEHYKADPIIGKKVRVLAAGSLPARLKLLWREGVVDACTDTGWRIRLQATAKEPEQIEEFGAEELEVLA